MKLLNGLHGVKLFLLTLLMVAGLLSVAGCDRHDETVAPGEFDLAAMLGGNPQSDFAKVTEPREFVFPNDHWAHPEYRNEWWYVTGNVSAADGREFGYQVTLFRVSLSPHAIERASHWASNQVWMAHVALTDIAANKHYHDQRFARGALGLAGQQQEPFTVWLEDWQISGHGSGQHSGQGVGAFPASFPWTIDIATQDFRLALQIAPDKPVVLQGDQGLSQKSAKAGNASYYYSFTRLQTSGRISVTGEDFAVSGLSWLDREWSTSALGANQAGWDWFSLQLDDGAEVMYYRMRTKTGDTDSFSKGVWVNPGGDYAALPLEAVTLEPLRWWRSSATGIRYPVQWRMKIAARDKTWLISAAVDAQEMVTGIRYWEGAVRVEDENSGDQMGKGYLEMTGYAASGKNQ